MVTNAEKPRSSLPPLPPVRRRIHLNIGWLLVAAVIGALLCYPAYMLASALVGSSYLKQGTESVQAGRYDEARDQLNSAMQWSDSSSDAYAARYDLALRSGKLELAINDYSAIIADHPSRYLPYCYRAEVYRRLDKPDLAFKDYHSCLDREPDHIWQMSAQNSLRTLERQGID